jgi:hypothetical protein
VVTGLEIAFINDASIPRPESVSSGRNDSLLLDVTDAVGQLLAGNTPIVLFGNVNRGILVEEENTITGNPLLAGTAGQIAAGVVRWLARPPSQASGSVPGDRITTTVGVGAGAPFYGQFKVTLTDEGANQDILVHALYLDMLSLLEPVPGAPGSAIDFSSDPPQVAQYVPFGGFADAGAIREATIAGELLQQATGVGKWDGQGCRNPADGSLCQAHPRCPFAQNARWLRNADLQRTFLDFLRAGEIAAGRRLTYRDLVGHLSLAVIGQPEQAWLSGSHPCAWAASQILAVGAGKKEASAELFSHRVYMNLFPPPDPVAWRRSKAVERQGGTVYRVAVSRMVHAGDSARVRAFEQAFNQVDPSRDTEDWNLLRAKVLDAVEALDVVAPSSEVSNWPSLPGDVHSDIEHLLDQALSGEIAIELASPGTPPTMRARLLRKWRCVALLRQVGLALGYFAFGRALKAWAAEQESAIQGSGPLALGNGLQSLILPTNPHGQILVAPLRPRTYVLAEHPRRTVVALVSLSDLRVAVVARGDVLSAEIQLIKPGKPPEALASMTIDLAVAREAILQAGGDRTSFTEIGDSAFARIERCRASLVQRARSRAIAVHFTTASGELLRLSPNPAGPAPLRIPPIGQ